MPGQFGSGVRILNATEAEVIGAQAPLFTFTIPAGRWRLLYVQSIYTADANAGNRTPRFTVFDDTGVEQYTVGFATQVAASTFRHMYVSGGAEEFVLGELTSFPIPARGIVQEGWSFRVGSTGFVGAGDEQLVSFQLASPA